MNVPQLSSGLLLILFGVALASLIVSAVGLAMARRRAAPLRHGMLMCALGVLALVPVAPLAARRLDIDWLPRLHLLSSTGASDVSEISTTSTAETTSDADDFRTLTAAEIPAGGVLPGQGSRGSDSSAKAQSATGSASASHAIWIHVVNWFNSSEIGSAFVALWGLGTLISLIRIIHAAMCVARLVRRSAPVGDASALALLSELAGDLRLRRPPELRAAAHLRVPFAWGFTRPVIVVSQQLVEPCDLARLRPILLHEMAHVRRHDVWIGLLQRVVGAVYWWNPLVHRLNVCLADAREDICDAYVLNSGCPSRQYAEILVDLAAQLSLPHPAAALGLLSRSEPQLTRRVQRLLEDQPMSTSLRRLTNLALLGVFIVLTTTAVLMACVLIGDPVTRSQFTSSVHPNWTPPQPVTVTNLQPASQQFIEVPAAPVYGTDSMTMAAGDADPFQPSGAGFGFGRGVADVADNRFAAGGAAPPMAGGMPGMPLMGATQMATTQPGMAMYVFSGDKVKGLTAIELIGNDDGSLQEVRWFTESLGTGDEAFAKLTERLAEFAKPRVGPTYRAEYQNTAAGPAIALTPAFNPVGGKPFRPGMAAFGVGGLSGGGGDAPIPTALTAQITASPQLRYEHVARVVELCESHVQHVVVTQANLTPQVTLTLGFVRDGSGKQISASPVLIWNNAVAPATVETVFQSGLQSYDPTVHDPTEVAPPAATPQMPPPHDEIVTVESLMPRLFSWRQTLSGDAVPKNLTVLVRADAGVDPKLVERVVQATLPAGFERVILRPLENPSAAHSVDPAAIQEPAAPHVEPAATQEPAAPQVAPAAIQEPAAPQVEPAPTQEPVAPQVEPPPATTQSEAVPTTIVPQPGLQVIIPAMGPTPIAIDFAHPLIGDTSDRERVFNFYVGFTR